MLKLLSPTIGIELACLLTALFFLWKEKNAEWRSQLLFLTITVATELRGRQLGLAHIDNDQLYNWYMIAECGFVGWLLTGLIGTFRQVSKLRVASAGLFTLLYAAEVCWHKRGIGEFNNVTTLVFSTLFIAGSVCFLYLLVNDEGTVVLSRFAPFWWTAGTLCYYYGSSVSVCYFTIFDFQHKRIFSYRHYTYLILNIILYACWSYSFYCRYRQRRSIH